jgi:hypothetical protein
MAHPLSILGIVHTAISLAPFAAGLYGFARHGKIDPATRAGQVYGLGMVASVLTSFGLSSTGGFNPGHALGLLALLAVAAGTLAPRIAALGRAASYIQTMAMSFSFLLLMVPGTNETLSRLPVGHPIGNGPDSAPVQRALLAVFLLFVIGTGYQLVKLRAARSRVPGNGQ